MVGRGIIKMVKSVIMLIAAVKYQTGIAGRHFPVIEGTMAAIGKQAVLTRSTETTKSVGINPNAIQLQRRAVHLPARNRRYCRRKDNLMMLIHML